MNPPEEDQATIDEWIAFSRQLVPVTEGLADAARAKDAQAMKASVAEGDQLNNKADAIADDYGMVDCGSAGN